MRTEFDWAGFLGYGIPAILIGIAIAWIIAAYVWR